MSEHETIVVHKYKLVNPDDQAVQYIGRPSRWGNPYKIQPGQSREEVLVKYVDYIAQAYDLHPQIVDLRGKLLSCYCAPLECHGDVLSVLADHYEVMVEPFVRRGERLPYRAVYKYAEQTGPLAGWKAETVQSWAVEIVLNDGTRRSMAVDRLNGDHVPTLRRALELMGELLAGNPA